MGLCPSYFKENIMREIYSVTIELAIVMAGILAVYLLMCEMNKEPTLNETTKTQIIHDK
jgi:hypothetical protein